jgi:protein-tyrosine phosphatase
MIDIHSHILPGVDDGARSIEESIKILQKAADAGVTTIVATPHVLEVPSGNDWQRVRDAFNRVKQKIVQENIYIEIILGAELFISPELPQSIEENRELCINNGSYVLLELPMLEIPPFTMQTIFELLIKGIQPIIAHPERYFEIQKDDTKLSKLIKRGVLTQLNCGSLLGRYGKRVQKTARILLKHNLIHMIASDIHSIPDGSYPLSQGVNRAAGLIGTRKARQMVTSIPARVIRGEEIATFPCISGKARKIAAGGIRI